MIDVTQSRVKQALRRATNVFDLKRAINLVENDLRNDNIESAIQHIFKVLHQQVPIRNDINYNIILNLQRQIVDRLLKKEEDARSKKQYNELLKLYRLYPLVDQAYKGLVAYSKLVVEGKYFVIFTLNN